MNWLREPDTEPIPGYRLVEPLGTGGFGEVWKCVAPGGLYKAIKFVYGNLSTLDTDSCKAEQEFKALERVKFVRHPFVLSMEQIQIVGGELLIVMELADKSLHDLMSEYQQLGRPGLPREMLLGFLADAAEGLDHLNEKHNLQHLDVKPKNLFLIADRVKVADFGLVKHLERQSTSGIMGGITPVYASPETFTNKFSKHSDQYSLAVVYIELLTGQRPFNGKNIRQLALQHMTEPPDLSMLPPSDRPVVARALAKDPTERFPSCLAFVRALGGLSLQAEVTQGSQATIETPPPVRPRTLPEFSLTATQPISLRPLRTGRVAAPEQPRPLAGDTTTEAGVLRPTILLGIGSFGRRALQQVRCRLLDRVGELGQVPAIRFVYIDVDSHGGEQATTGPADAALRPEQIFHAPLQPVNSYRRRHLDQLLEWLPREKLYAIPRNLKVEGSRALGRLAFSDHYLRFLTRLRHEIQLATHPEALRESADQTGLPIRSKMPAVFVFASATGGTGGMLVDVGQAVRRALERFHATEAPVTAFLFTGAPEDPSSPPEELANTFATLTELNHFADPEVRFSARYGGPEGPHLEACGFPFTATYLLPMTERTADGFRDCLSRLAGYVAHTMTTPLGVELEKIRQQTPPPDRTPFRGFGTFGVWYPRGLLLRSAARQLCAKLLKSWISEAPAEQPGEARRILAAILTDPRLTPDEVQHFIARETPGHPVEAVHKWAAVLHSQASQAANDDDPALWAETVWAAAREHVGAEPTTEADSDFRRGRLSRALDLGMRRAVEAWQSELREQLRPLEEIAGPRVAATEWVLRELVAAATSAITAVETRLQQYGEARRKAVTDVQGALEASRGLHGITFSLFGSRIARTLAGVAGRIKDFTELRVKEDLATAALGFYRRLRGWFDELLRDLALARSRGAELAGLLEAQVLSSGNGVSNYLPDLAEEANAIMQATLHGSNTIRVVLPHGERQLDRAAAEMLTKLSPEERARLELVLTRLVVEPRGGFAVACRRSIDLATPMVEQTTAFLTKLLPTEDVTAVELAAVDGLPGEFARRLASYVEAAAAPTGGPSGEERMFVVVPATRDGQRYAEEIERSVPNAEAVPVRGPGTDLLFCREQGWLRTEDLFRMLEPCWEAYHQASACVETNPHARFDILGWLPLVE